MGQEKRKSTLEVSSYDREEGEDGEDQCLRGKNSVMAEEVGILF